MRKILISCNRANATAATAVTLLMALCLTASCCHHGKAIDPDDDIPISMSVSSTGTKAIVNDLDGMIGQCFNDQNQYIEGKGFGVYGYKKESSGTSIKIFDNVPIRPDSKTTTTWTYSPKRYWDSDPNVSYQFIAYWPRLTDVVSATAPYVSVLPPVSGDHTEGTKVLTIHNVPNWQQIRDTDGDGDVDEADGTQGVLEEIDFMTATESGYYGAEFPDGKVYFKFHHLLSQLIVQAYYINGSNNATEGGVFIKEITLQRSGSTNDVPAFNEHTDFTQPYTATLATVGTITYAESSTILNLAEANARPVAWKNEWVSSPDFAPSVIGRWLMVPHVWNGIKIKVNHKDGGGDYHDSTPIEVTLGKAENYYATLPDKTYIITLIINVSNGGITVADIAVRSWLEAQKAIQEVYNW